MKKPKYLHLFKIKYIWYEGEEGSTILATTKDIEEIEKDLKEVAKSIKIDDKGLTGEGEVDVLTTAYEHLIRKLEKKGYIECEFVYNPDYLTTPTYLIEDEVIRNKSSKYYIVRHVNRGTERTTLK